MHVLRDLIRAREKEREKERERGKLPTGPRTSSLISCPLTSSWGAPLGVEGTSPGAGRVKRGFEEESSSLLLLLWFVVFAAGGCCDGEEEEDIL